MTSFDRRRFLALAALAAGGCAGAPRGDTLEPRASRVSGTGAIPIEVDSLQGLPKAQGKELEAEPRKATYPLFDAHPRLAERLARVDLGASPSPVERADALGRAVGIADMYVKRDDVAGRLYGGSKARKLELLLAAAQKLGKRRVITFGSAGSHHALATAIYARELGLAATLLLLPEPASDEVRTHLLGDLAAGAELVASPGRDREDELARRLAGDDAIVLPRGGTSALGNVAFVNAAFELEAQIAAGALPPPERVYIALGTLGAAVGLALGLAAIGRAIEVVAVRASSPETSSRARADAAYRATAALLRELDPSFRTPDSLDGARFSIVASELGGGYAQPTARARAAVELGRTAGYRLETTYTGKALAALTAGARALEGQTVLFWNTHNSKPIAIEGADPAKAPKALRGYLV